MRRFIDILASIAVLLLFGLPCAVIWGAVSLLFGRNFLTCRKIFGKDCSEVKVCWFGMRNTFFSSLPLFFSLLKGDITLVGTSFYFCDEYSQGQLPKEITSLKPGIFNLWYVKKHTKIHHAEKTDIDLLQLSGRGLKKDLAIIIKYIPASLYKSDETSIKDTVTLLDVTFNNCTMNEALGFIQNGVENSNKGMYFFINPDCLNKTFTDKYYFDILRSADYVFPDGVGINIGSKMTGQTLKQNVNGTDMFPLLCSMCQQRGYSMYFLGAKPGIAARMVSILREEYTSLKIAGYRDGYFQKDGETESVIEAVNKTGAQVLLVAFGVPVQEKWIYENRSRLSPPVVMGVGGLFDFYSGNIRRAPGWLRDLGGEWIYRLIQEPGRMWRRYILGNPVFLHRVRKWKKQLDKG
ncbi:Putative N-acetylmannosaminyltransferase [Sedimentisphaera cyanobacteriorum]|uniref:N-acetylmannosaminyltransferase n=1 Tax=Sedimentisphaera cyanobacteriorum TaxID=1940790 RepID=A0A1Q2HN48_9BACT|nr:WecB/TagA/CpsF family glycosyltransferase [Sedimentisphaera cyanobacteriorum]AQQ08949.1 Putative N-acetylmannosaminyltransferase [Sedimentisphaera cyanobacteriorum]